MKVLPTETEAEYKQIFCVKCGYELRSYVQPVRYDAETGKRIMKRTLRCPYKRFWFDKHSLTSYEFTMQHQVTQTPAGKFRIHR